ncbi:MAG TPA: glycosyltransferase [Thermoanaerobaculia bacterium]|nr:glycosyltransferase [Thermoanaerobaculia bacterium]
MTIVGLVLVAAYLALVLDLVLHRRSIVSLDELPLQDRGARPRVSIVVAARDEERKIGDGLRSLLALDYPDLEIVVVDDRSADGTGRVIAALAEKDSRIRPIRIEELPDGWLGKNHALQRGTDQATGSLVLFTDADVMLEPTIMKRAAGWMIDQGVDHLTASPRIVNASFPLRLFVASFTFFMALGQKPWRVADPRSRAHIGIGAFNLVRRSVYERVGGHHPIRMRPDDDLKLGKLLKEHGAKQRFASGGGLIRVEWYRTVREAIAGLMKNAYSVVEFNPALLIWKTLLVLFTCLWPFAALLLLAGAAFWIHLGVALLILGLAGHFASRSGLPALYAIAFPFETIVFLFVLWRSAVLTHLQGGIRWRGTFYNLSELKARNQNEEPETETRNQKPETRNEP